MKQQWIFANPLWLWALPALIAGGVALWFAWRAIVHRRLARFVAPRHFADAMPGVNWRLRAVQFGLAVAVLTLLAFTLARPMRGPTGDNAESLGVDFVLALDVSKSMWVEDVEPNRLAAVKKQLGEWIKKLHGDRMGLVLFAGDALVQAPITYDYTALSHVLQHSGPRSISYGGTNIPKAVERSVDLLKNSQARTRILVIVTDGENLEGDALGVVRQARMSEGLTIFTVGVGTPAGGRVPAADYSARRSTDKAKSYVRNEYGVGVTSKLDRRSLRLLAEAGGGRYYELKPDANIFEALHQQSLMPLARKSQKIDLKQYEDWFQLPLGLAILLTVAGPLVSLVRARPAKAVAGVEVVMPETLSKATTPRTFIRVRRATSLTAVLLLSIAVPAFAQSPAPAPPYAEAEKLLAARKGDEAVQLMRKAVEQDEKNPYLFYNYALTLYRAGRHEEAIAAFTALRQTTDLPDLQQLAAVQLGNAHVHLSLELKKGSKLPGAILSLERALSHYDEIPPDQAGKDVKNNRQVASVRLEKYLLEAGAHYIAQADARAKNYDHPQEEPQLRSALQAYERVTEINPKNTEAAKTAQQIRERLAKNLAAQAKNLTRQADQIVEQNQQPTTRPTKPQDPMPKLEAAVAKLEDALTLTPDSKPIQKQKQDVQNRISDLHTAAAEKQMARPMEKPKLEDKDQQQLAAARTKLEQALALNPENTKAQELHQQASQKLEQSHVERGQAALANAEKQTRPESRLGNLQRAAEQFQKALSLNENSEPARQGLAEANQKLPEAFAAAGDAEAQKAKEAMAGKSQPAKPAPSRPSTQDLQKAVGFLEKANQNYGMALSMAPENPDLQQRAEAIAEMLAGARDELDEQQREALAANGEESPVAGSSEAPANTQRTLLNMSDLAGKAKPNTGDNFWERQKRDW